MPTSRPSATSGPISLRTALLQVYARPCGKMCIERASWAPSACMRCTHRLQIGCKIRRKPSIKAKFIWAPRLESRPPVPGTPVLQFCGRLGVCRCCWRALGGACVLQFYCRCGAILSQSRRRFRADNGVLLGVWLRKAMGFRRSCSGCGVNEDQLTRALGLGTCGGAILDGSARIAICVFWRGRLGRLVMLFYWAGAPFCLSCFSLC